MPFSRKYAFALLAGALLLPSPLYAVEATQDDAPAPESVDGLEGPMERSLAEKERPWTLFPRLKRRVQGLPEVLRDMSLVFKPRSYYLSRRRLDGRRQIAWASGGSVAFESGALKETLAFGAEVFSSWKLVGRKRHDGTLLLKPGQHSYSVVGRLYAKLRYEEHTATFYRQFVDLPYVNRQDSRMSPNTFEGYTLIGALGNTRYFVGHLTRMKQRNRDRFESMSEVAGVPGNSSKGLSIVGLMGKNRSGSFSIGAINLFGKDYLNTLYAESSYLMQLPSDLQLRLSAQLSDQRSVGDDLLTGRGFDTRAGGAQLALSYRRAILRLAFSTTDAESGMRSPFGSYPGYLSLMQRDFFRADEDAWLVGLSYVFTALGLPDLSMFANFARGTGARSSATGVSLPDNTELDLTLDYHFEAGTWRGFWLRVRGSTLKTDGSPDRSHEIRVILKYEIPAL